MSVAEKLNTIAENEQKVYDAGKVQRDYEWWDYYQSQYKLLDNSVSGDRKSYQYAFAGYGWRDDNYNPIRTITAHDNTTNMYAYSAITDTKVTVDVAGTTATNKGSTFANATLLATVRKFVVNELTGMTGQFNNCSKLQNLTIEGTIARNAYFQWCPLTPTSMKSVISALKNFAVNDPDNVYTQTLQFSDDCWAALEADSTAPDGGTWREYVGKLGWNA